MKTPFALALALSLVLGASPALAWSSGGQRSVFPTQRDPWRQWGHADRGHGHFQGRGHQHFRGHRSTIIVAPRSHGQVFVPAPHVFVPGHWAWWHGYGWVWVPGHWAW